MSLLAPDRRHAMSQHEDLPQPAVVEIGGATTAIVRGVVPVDQLAAFFDRSFTELTTVLTEQGATIVGPAFARYHRPLSETADLEVGFATSRPVRPQGDVRVGSLPAGRVVRSIHAGSFDGLTAAWDRLRTWIDDQGLTAGSALWEVYLTEPTPDMDPADLRTELNWSLG